MSFGLALLNVLPLVLAIIGAILLYYCFRQDHHKHEVDYWTSSKVSLTVFSQFLSGFFFLALAAMAVNLMLNCSTGWQPLEGIFYVAWKMLEGLGAIKG